MESTANTKLYIATLKHNLWQKRLYFEGEDSEYGKQQFALALRRLNEVGDTSKDWLDFLQKAIGNFKEYGFTRVPK